MLVVFAGLPGTGKTTLARLLASRHSAAHLRVDAVEAAMHRTGHTRESIGATGYVVVQEVARSCLEVGTPVVIDAVSPVPEARQSWRDLAAASSEWLTIVEVAVSDRTEHRRRVEDRRSDIEGLTVPTWHEVTARNYEPWDDVRDGPRLELLNDTTPEQALAVVLAHISSEREPDA